MSSPDYMLDSNKPRKFAGSVFSEQELEHIIIRAAKGNRHNDGNQSNALSLDLSGADLTGERALFASDILTRGRMFSFVHIDISNTRLSNNGCECLLSVASECKQLVTLRMKSNSLTKEVGHALGNHSHHHYHCHRAS